MAGDALAGTAGDALAADAVGSGARTATTLPALAARCVGRGDPAGTTRSPGLRELACSGAAAERAATGSGTTLGDGRAGGGLDAAGFACLGESHTGNATIGVATAAPKTKVIGQDSAATFAATVAPHPTCAEAVPVAASPEPTETPAASSRLRKRT